MLKSTLVRDLANWLIAELDDRIQRYRARFCNGVYYFQGESSHRSRRRAVIAQSVPQLQASGLSFLLTLTASFPSLSMTTHLPSLTSARGKVLLGYYLKRTCPRRFRGNSIPACPILSGNRQECLSYAVRVTDRRVCPTVGTYVNGRRLPLQGRGWGFESLRDYQKFENSNLRSQI